MVADRCSAPVGVPADSVRRAVGVLIDEECRLPRVTTPTGILKNRIPGDAGKRLGVNLAIRWELVRGAFITANVVPLVPFITGMYRGMLMTT